MYYIQIYTYIRIYIDVVLKLGIHVKQTRNVTAPGLVANPLCIAGTASSLSAPGVGDDLLEICRGKWNYQRLGNMPRIGLTKSFS